MMKTLISASLIATIAMAGSTGVAFADHHGGKKDREGPRAMLKNADTNEDGSLSKDEFNAFNKLRFEKYDADKNGVVNQADIDAMAQDNDDDKKRGKRGYGRIKAMDTNWDGQVTEEEFMALANERFERMDDDGDGQIDRKDMKKSWKKMRKGKHGDK